MTSAACPAIQGLNPGIRGTSRSATKNATTRAAFCTWNFALSAATALRSRTGAESAPAGFFSIALDLPPLLDAEQALRPQRQQRHDHHERGRGLVVRAEVAAGEVLRDADHERAHDRAG